MTKLVHKSLRVCLLSLLVGCSSTKLPTSQDSPVSGRDYELSIEDIPAERRVAVAIQAKSDRELCVGPRDWPTSIGRMESKDATIVIGSRLFSYTGFDMDLCPFKACGHPIRNGMTLSATLKYDDFGIPVELSFGEKEIQYSPKPYWCEDAHWIDSPKRD